MKEGRREKEGKANRVRIQKESKRRKGNKCRNKSK
jgi:hypothetical protein